MQHNGGHIELTDIPPARGASAGPRRHAYSEMYGENSGILLIMNETDSKENAHSCPSLFQLVDITDDP